VTVLACHKHTVVALGHALKLHRLAAQFHTRRMLLSCVGRLCVQVFQRDLVKMRLETARALVKVLSDGQVGAWSRGEKGLRTAA
jgi:hypothetical protein